MIETLKLDPDNRTKHEIELERARIQGFNDAIKLMIDKIINIQDTMKACGYEISEDFIKLKNALGVIVYKDWDYDN